MRKIIGRVAIVVLVLGGGMSVAGTAVAAPNGPVTETKKGCAVVLKDSTGTVVGSGTVVHGTVVGGRRCNDGTWETARLRSDGLVTSGTPVLTAQA
jgi:hypothetical protein